MDSKFARTNLLNTSSGADVTTANGFTTVTGLEKWRTEDFISMTERVYAAETAQVVTIGDVLTPPVVVADTIYEIHIYAPQATYESGSQSPFTARYHSPVTLSGNAATDRTLLYAALATAINNSSLPVTAVASAGTSLVITDDGNYNEPRPGVTAGPTQIYAGRGFNTFVGTQEVFTVQNVADTADDHEGTYWTAELPNGEQHYFWYDNDSRGADPAVAGMTGHGITIATADIANDIAAATQAVVDAVPGFSATVLTDTTTVTLDNAGTAVDAANVDVPGATAVIVTVQGEDIVEVTTAGVVGEGVGQWLIDSAPTFSRTDDNLQTGEYAMPTGAVADQNYSLFIFESWATQNDNSVTGGGGRKRIRQAVWVDDGTGTDNSNAAGYGTFQTAAQAL